GPRHCRCRGVTGRAGGAASAPAARPTLPTAGAGPCRGAAADADRCRTRPDRRQHVRPAVSETSRLSRIRTGATIAIAGLVFGFSWLLRFNDPSGAFAGLTDDHFFYVVRGWQILFGELPVRDFVDHGAPGYFYVSAA